MGRGGRSAGGGIRVLFGLGGGCLLRGRGLRGKWKDRWFWGGGG